MVNLLLANILDKIFGGFLFGEPPIIFISPDFPGTQHF